MAGWKTEVQYQTDENDQIIEIDGKEQVAFVRYGQITGEQVDCNVGYGFFDTEEEAAADFLKEIEEHSESRYLRSDYQDALQAVAKE